MNPLTFTAPAPCGCDVTWTATTGPYAEPIWHPDRTSPEPCPTHEES